MKTTYGISAVIAFTLILSGGPALGRHIDPGIRRELIRTADALIKDARHSRDTFRAMCGACGVAREADRFAFLAEALRHTAVRDVGPLAVVGDFERLERQFRHLRRSYRAAAGLRSFPNVRFEWELLEQSYRELAAALWPISRGKGMMELFGDE